jgi:hypothetical protein
MNDNTMKKLKENLQITLIILSVVALICGIGFVKYKIWKAEHPQAKTWTFFIPKGK